jgi:hypothetical protein
MSPLSTYHFYTPLRLRLLLVPLTLDICMGGQAWS